MERDTALRFDGSTHDYERFCALYARRAEALLHYYWRRYLAATILEEQYRRWKEDAIGDSLEDVYLECASAPAPLSDEDIARRLATAAVGHLRRYADRHIEYAAAAEPIEPAPQPTELLLEQVHSFIAARFSQLDRDIFRLLEEGHSQRDIARTLRVPYATVRQHICRCRRLLRRLDEHGGG